MISLIILILISFLEPSRTVETTIDLDYNYDFDYDRKSSHKYESSPKYIEYV